VRGEYIGQGPEGGAVIEMTQMRHFVRDNIILDEGRGHHEAPAKHQCPLGGATAPAAARVAHRDAAWREADASRLGDGAGGEPNLGVPAQEIRHTLRHFGRVARHVESIAPQNGCAAVWRVSDQVRDAFDGDAGAVLYGRHVRQGGQRRRDPAGIFPKQRQPRRLCGAPRQSNHHLPPPRIDPQRNTPRGCMPPPKYCGR